MSRKRTTPSADTVSGLPHPDPDWTQRKPTIGGKLEDVPKPHILFFRDHPKGKRAPKREVTITRTKFHGIGVHWWVEIEEEDDFVWDALEGEWRRVAYNRLTAGEKRSSRFYTPEAVEKFVLLTLKDTFPRETHTYIEGHVRAKWLYREGD